MGTKVHVTLWPDAAIDVDESELLDLQRQGLIIPSKGDINDKGDVKKTVLAEQKKEGQ